MAVSLNPSMAVDYIENNALIPSASSGDASNTELIIQRVCQSYFAGSDSQRSPALQKVIDTLQNWLYLPDPGVFETVFAAYAANQIEGCPVWLMVVGGPSSGKTEAIVSLLTSPHVISCSTLTEAALLSGTSGKDWKLGATGGLLRQINQFGILLLKDFTSALSMKADQFNAVLAALREIYDGEWNRFVGSDGGQSLSWKGKMGLIGGVTSAIDSRHAVMTSMGERFVFFRLPEIDPLEQARQAADVAGFESEMREEIAAEVCEFFSQIDFKDVPPLSQDDQKWLIPLASLVVISRSAVDRNVYTHAIELKHQPEAPGRLMKVLSQLVRAMKLIGMSPARIRQLVVKIGIDCIPPVRGLILNYLKNKSATVKDIAAGIGNYSASTVDRNLDDLRCHGVVEEFSEASVKAPHWRITERWNAAYCNAIGGGEYIK